MNKYDFFKIIKQKKNNLEKSAYTVLTGSHMSIIEKKQIKNTGKKNQTQQTRQPKPQNPKQNKKTRFIHDFHFKYFLP